MSSTTLSSQPFLSPTQISGCQQWLDATDPNGTGSLPADGASLTTWVDKSGNGRNVSQNAALVVPVFRLSLASNGLAGLDFTGGAGLLSASSFAKSLNVTVLLVGMVRSTIAGWGTFWGHFPSGDHDNNAIQLRNTAGQSVINWHTNNNNSTSQLTYILNSMVLYSCTMTSGNIMFMQQTNVAGTSSVNVTNASVTINTNAAPTWVGRSDLTGEAINSYIYEIVYYQRVLSTSERQQMEGYLAWKWGLQTNLPSSHPYRYNPVGIYAIPRNLGTNVTNTMGSSSLPFTFFNPNQISGCQLWLDAADTSTMTPSNPSSGTSITAWRDKSTTNKAVTVSSAPKFFGPTATTNSVLVFANGPQVSASLPAAIGTGDVCLVAVWSVTIGGTNTVLGIGPASSPSLGIGFSGNKYNFYDFGVVGGESSYTTTTTNVYLIEIGTRISGVMQLFVNGTGYTPATNTTPTNQTSTTIYVGNGAFAINGNIAEILVYNSAVITSQRQQLEGYLAWKWGLQTSLPASHPYKNTPPGLPVSSVPLLRQLVIGQFGPLRISGCQLWLDASDPTTITANGTAMSGWTDKSGTARTITFVGSSNTYNASTKSVDTDNATLNYFYANVNLKRSVTTYANVFIVHTWTGSASGGNQALWGQDIGGGWNRFQLLSFTTTPSYAYGLSYTPSSPQVIAVSALNTPNRVLYNATYAYQVANGTYASVNGTQASISVTEAPASPETSTTNTYFATIDTGYSGKVAFHEILIYTSNLTRAQTQSIEGYLAWKWSLQGNLPANHPYKMFPPPP